MRGTLAQSRAWRLGRAAFERYRADEVDTHATALAYQLFLSTLALSLVGLALIGLAEEVLPFDLPEGTEEQFGNLVQGSAALGAASGLLLLWTAAALARRASKALGIVFRTGTFGAIGGGLRSLGVTLGLVVLIGAMPVLTGVVSLLRAGAGLDEPLRVLGWAGLATVEFGLFLLSYVVLTPGKVPWRAHVPGALVMTAGWELFKLAGGVFLAAYVSRATLLYGTIGSVVALLVVLRMATWLYLVGAELSALRLERPARDQPTSPTSSSRPT
jgi:uncharacterized BrkB/YihY/UPF0761 family membrane protein